MPRVYVAHQPRPTAGPNSRNTYDITPALQYGEVVFVFEASFSPSSNPEEAAEIAHEKLKDIQPGDYIVWAGGDPLAAFIVGALAADKTAGQLKYLRWDRERGDGGIATGRGCYSPVALELFTDAED